MIKLKMSVILKFFKDCYNCPKINFVLSADGKIHAGRVIPWAFLFVYDVQEFIGL